MNDAANVLQFDKFDLKDLIYDQNGDFINPKIAIIAKSGSGKSWVIREIIYHLCKDNIPCATVIAPTDKMTKFYNDFIPECFIHHDYKDEIVAKVLHRQKKMIEQNELRKKINKDSIDPRSVFIMDDCLTTASQWIKDPNIISIFNEGRHYQLTYILSLQYSIGIPPNLRSNIDFVFLLGEDNYNNRKRLYENFAGILPSRELFEMVFSELTNDYGCMVINNRIRSNDLRKKVFHFRSNKTPDFKLGIPKVIKFNEDNFDKDHEKNNFFDVNTIVNRRRKLNVKIKINTA
jgi:hypothetical protein